MKAKQIEIIDVNEGNFKDVGFFCYMSKRKAEGYQRKSNWLSARFSEGLKIKMLKLPERGFIEYVPGEYAWRPVNAKGYLFIHCLWVVGKSKGKGYASHLLDECIKDAKRSGMKGVAMVTSGGNWLVGKDLLDKHGFDSVGQAPPSFELMVKKFGRAKSPYFANDWDQRLKRYPKGLTVFRSDQCPYIEDATNTVVETSEEQGMRCHIVEIKSCEEIREESPSAYGVFNVVYDGQLFTYHYLLKKELLNRIGR